MSEAEELLQPAEAAAMLGVHPDTLQAWAEAGRIQVFRTLGKHRRYRRGDVLELREQMMAASAPDEEEK